VEQAITLAQECEAAAMGVDKRINNSEGASVSTHESLFVYANSLGFIGGYPTTRQGISCAVVAESDQGMQRDYWYATARAAADLDNAAAVGRMAGERTVRRLDARKLKTMQVPVLFEAPLASSLLGSFVGAVSGGSLYRNPRSCSTAWARKFLPPSSTCRNCPTCPKASPAAPSTTKASPPKAAT